MLIASFTLVRLTLLIAIGFGNDEAYTIAGARTLHLSYFDHPPLHVWLTHAASLVFGETRWIRLPFVLLFSATSWLMFLLTRWFYGEQAALWALLYLNLSPFFTLSAGGWVVPDGTLLFCLLAAVLAVVPVMFPFDQTAHSPWRAWPLAGLWFELAGLSKYNALFIALGLVAFIAGTPRHRRWLRHPAPYLGAALALAVLAPVLVWNARNGWISFIFQAARGLPQGGLHPGRVLAMVAGEAALLSPWIAVPLVAALSAACSGAPERDRDRFFLALALPAIAGLTLAPFWSARGLPHWPMPAWMFVYPLLGAWIHRGGRLWFAPASWAVGSTVAFALLLVVGVTLARQGWASQSVFGSNAVQDPTLEALDWTALRSDGVVMAFHPGFAVTTRWMDAGKVAVALGAGIQVYVFSEDPRQFAFAPPVSRFLGQDAVIIVPARLLSVELPKLRPFFAALDPAEHFWIGRGDAAELELAVIHAHALLAPFPLPYPGLDPGSASCCISPELRQ